MPNTPAEPPPGAYPPSDHPLGDQTGDRLRDPAGPTPADLTDTKAIPADPLDRVTLDASLTKLLMVVLESLPPAKRVAFLLHDVFGVPYDTISQIVGRSPTATKTLARSARRRIHYRHPDVVKPDRAGRVEHELLLACAAGNATGLEKLLDPEITVLIDGGGKVQASNNTVRGVTAAAALLITLLANDETIVVTEQSVNGRIGLVLRQSGQVISIVMVNVRDDLVLDVWITANPEKLRLWNTK